MAERRGFELSVSFAGLMLGADHVKHQILTDKISLAVTWRVTAPREVHRLGRIDILQPQTFSRHQKRPMVRIPFAPATSQCELAVLPLHTAPLPVPQAAKPAHVDHAGHRLQLCDRRRRVVINWFIVCGG
jgi:hypothetical protein